MSLVRCIRDNYSSLVRRSCQEKGTGNEIKPGKCKNSVVIKWDEYKLAPGSKCDCIIFAEEDGKIILGVIEMKSKTVHVSDVLKQLQACAKAAEDMVLECQGNPQAIEIFPIVTSKKIDRLDKKTLGNNKILFHGKRREIITQKYGLAFMKIVSKNR